MKYIKALFLKKYLATQESLGNAHDHSGSAESRPKSKKDLVKVIRDLDGKEARNLSAV